MHRSLILVVAALAAFTPTSVSLAADPAPASPPAARADGRLRVGDPAPVIKNATWIKGEPVLEWVKGQIYVIDFWATWCGPCVQTIPHINSIQASKKDKGVNVIGFAIWARKGQRDTRAFVEARGDGMSYRVVEDDKNGTNAKAFMDATGQGGIPTVMIIDREGRLAWVGHPMAGMDGVLDKVIAGTYDVATAAKEAADEAEKSEKSEGLMTEFGKAQMAEDWAKALDVTDRMLAHDPETFWQAGIFKYIILLTKLNDPTRAGTAGRELVAGPLSKSGEALSILGRVITQDDQIPDDKRDFDLAFDAATRARELTKGQDPNALSALASVAHHRKEHDKAVELQTAAYELVKDQEGVRDEFQETLARFKAAAPEAAKKE